jgi:hypothetical protein
MIADIWPTKPRPLRWHRPRRRTASDPAAPMDRWRPGRADHDQWVGGDTERTQASHLHGRFAAQDHAAERPIFETEAYAYWARIGHRFDVINYSTAGLAPKKAIPDKAVR